MFTLSRHYTNQCLNPEKGTITIDGIDLSTITLDSYRQYLGTLLNEGPCKTYSKLVELYNMGYDGAKIIRAVMSPFVANDYNPLGAGGSTSNDGVGGFYPRY